MKRCNLLFPLIFLLLSSCGTDTGNPGFTSNPNLGSQPVSAFISGSLCDKIFSCFAVTPNHCIDQVNSAALLSTHLGLSEATYPNLLSIQTAVTNSTLQVDSTKANSCFQKIYSTSCSDSTVLDSFNVNSPNDISRIWRLLNLDSSCSQFIF